MAWVTWRQHRLAARRAGSRCSSRSPPPRSATHLPIRAAYHRDALSACLPPSARSGCDLIVRHFESEFDGWRRAARDLVVLPALAGLFVGAPLLARELEHGTHRLRVDAERHPAALAALEDGCSSRSRRRRRRRARARSSMWWRSPFDTLEGRMAPSGFDIEGLVVPAYALFALAARRARRAAPAAARSRRCLSTLVVFVATRLVVLEVPAPALPGAAASHRRGADPGRAGRRLGAERHARRRRRPADHRRPRGSRRPARAACRHRPARVPRLARLEARRSPTSPGGRFWTFQVIEAGLFVALAVARARAAVWFVRRTPA